MKIEIDDNHIDLITKAKKASISVDEVINKVLYEHIVMLFLNDVDQVTLANLKFKAEKIGKLIIKNGQSQL